MKNFFILPLLVYIYSCSQDQITNSLPKESTTNVSIVEGRMKFETLTDFDKFINQYSTDTGLIIPPILAQQHISHFVKVKSVSEEEKIALDTLKIGDPVLSRILNENLELQIGERIHKYSPSLHFLYVYNSLAQQQIDSLIAVESELKERFNCSNEDKHFEISKDVEVYYSSNPMFLVDTLATYEDIEEDGDYSTQIRPTAVQEFNNRKLTLKMWKTHAVFYVSCGYEITFEKRVKVWFVKYWKNENADLHLEWPTTHVRLTDIPFSKVPMGFPFYLNAGQKSQHNSAITIYIDYRVGWFPGYRYYVEYLSNRRLKGYVMYNGRRYNIEENLTLN